MTYILEEADKLRNQGQSLQAAQKYQEITDQTDDEQVKGAALHMAAVCYSQAGQHSDAEEYFVKAVKHYEDLSDTFNLARVNRDFGNCQMAQEGFQDNDDLGELAMTQAKLAALLAKQEDFDRAQSLVYEAIQNANRSKNKFYVSTAYKEAGRIYYLNKKYQAMIDCIYASLGVLQLEEDSHAKQHAEIYLSLSYAYKQLENIQLAEDTNTKAEEYLKQLDDESAERIRNYFSN